MADNTNRLNTQLNFAIPTTQEERDKIIFLAVKTLTEKEGGNITLNQILSYVDDNLNNLSDEVAKALINKSNNGHTHDDRYYTEDEINTKVNQLNSDLNNNVNELNNTLVAKTSMLSYEEIMASTPPIDLDVGIPKASAIKDISEVKTYSVAVGSSTLTFRKVGKIVSVYGYLENTGTATVIDFNIPLELSPKYNYVILDLYETSSPYRNTIGTIWLRASGATIYKESNRTDFYVCGTYIIMG